MYNHWTVDLTDSAVALESIKYSVLPKLVSGKIHNIESQKHEVLILLDTTSGIDYIRQNNTGLQGIAARVQWVGSSEPYNTFTIREKRCTGTKTEFEKRKLQIENGYFYPAFTLQAYFDNKVDNNLHTIAIIETKKLYQFIEENKDDPTKVCRNKSDNEFIYVHWHDLKGLGIKTYFSKEKNKSLEIVYSATQTKLEFEFNN